MQINSQPSEQSGSRRWIVYLIITAAVVLIGGIGLSKLRTATQDSSGSDGAGSDPAGENAANVDPSADAEADADADTVIEMSNTLKFVPDTVRVAIGATVEWQNTSLLVHTVTADLELATIAASAQLPVGAESFNSGNLDPEASFRHMFTVPGTYGYFCIPHEGASMRAIVIVEPQGN